jgi:hypothetical protein
MGAAISAFTIADARDRREGARDWGFGIGRGGTLNLKPWNLALET